MRSLPREYLLLVLLTPLLLDLWFFKAHSALRGPEDPRARGRRPDGTVRDE